MSARLPERALCASGVVLLGVVTGVIHLTHLTIERGVHAKVIGVWIPFSISLLLVGTGIWLYRTAIVGTHPRRIAGWTVIGLFAGLLFGYPVVQYQAAHQVVLVDVSYLVTTWITIGALGGVVVGFYDARQQDYSRRLEGERTELAARERELHRQNERLEQFASVISHDLRNPLNVATGRLAMAQAESDSEHLDDVDRALERIQVLIEDLLELAVQGAPIDEPEQVSLRVIADRTWSVVDTKEATLVQEGDCTFRADASRLQQLLENLVRNAVSHGDDAGTVRVGALPADGFYVADDGPGVPEGERDKVFDSGYSTGADGTGLGLAIVTEIAEAHGWRPSVGESDSGGARFEIRGVDVVAD